MQKRCGESQNDSWPFVTVSGGVSVPNQKPDTWLVSVDRFRAEKTKTSRDRQVMFYVHYTGLTKPQHNTLVPGASATACLQILNQYFVRPFTSKRNYSWIQMCNQPAGLLSPEWFVAFLMRLPTPTLSWLLSFSEYPTTLTVISILCGIAFSFLYI